MKKTLQWMLAMTLALILFPRTAQADGKVIPFDKMPAEARAFIKEHFGSVKVLQVTAEWDEYEVLLEDLTQVEFDRSGNWKQVKGKRNGLPEAIIPLRILSYVKEAFPEQPITQIERSRWGYEVNIGNGLELEFDKNCNFVRIDD